LFWQDRRHPDEGLRREWSMNGTRFASLLFLHNGVDFSQPCRSLALLSGL